YCQSTSSALSQWVGVPDAAGTITGTSPVCAGQSGATYSISSVTAAIGYTWTVPSGATITAGQNTTSITVTWGSTGGHVSVTPNNTCGNGTSSSLAVTVNAKPSAPVASNNGPICAGQTLNLTASTVSGV